MLNHRFDLSHINTSESYYGEIILRGDIICLPVINLGLMQGHPLNDEDRQVFIDKSYLVFKSVEYLLFNEAGNVMPEENDEKLIFYFGGQSLLNSTVYEIKICCKAGTLIILEDSKIQSPLWAPVHTPLIKQNMDSMEVAKFINNDAVFDYDSIFTK
jgi:hypothetical protein